MVVAVVAAMEDSGWCLGGNFRFSFRALIEGRGIMGTLGEYLVGCVKEILI